VLTSLGVTEQHDWFAGVHVVTGGEVSQDGGCDAWDGVDVEVCQPFQSRELGVVDAAGTAPFGAVVDLGGEDLGGVAQVGLAFPVGDLGQADRFGAQRGQTQLACGGADRGLRGGPGGPKEKPGSGVRTRPTRLPPAGVRSSSCPGTRPTPSVSW